MVRDLDDFIRDLSLINNFGDVWPIASLLHDVGYILEGSLSASTSQVEHERVINGAKVVNDYFRHYLWRHAVIDFRAAIAVAKKLECEVPDFSREFFSVYVESHYIYSEVELVDVTCLDSTKYNVYLFYPKRGEGLKEYADKVTKDLNRALKDWDRYVNIYSYDTKGTPKRM